MTKHDEYPEYDGELTEEQIRLIEQIMESPYAKHIQELREHIDGKVVSSSVAGRSGYMLEFEDGYFLICFLSENIMDWRVGHGKPSSSDLNLINQEHAGDGYAPLSVDVIYADEHCDITSEVAKSHDQPITGIAIGQNSFNLCFPGGRELGSMLVPDSCGKLALRVFWEQW